jgi:hypothetical protein
MPVGDADWATALPVVASSAPMAMPTAAPKRRRRRAVENWGMEDSLNRGEPDADQLSIAPRVRTYGSARELRCEFRTVRVGEALPGDTGVLVLSQYYEERYSLDLIGERPGRGRLPAQERVVMSRASSTQSRGSPKAAAHLTQGSWGGCSGPVSAAVRVTA